ncbi:MAG: hypothetical protein AB7K41_05380 [Bdellovibrionales bacterium]
MSRCERSLKRPTLKEYASLQCYRNVFCLLQALSRQERFEVDQAEILYLGPFLGFDFHVVLLYKGLIFDPRDLDEKNGVPQVRMNRYFKEKTWGELRLGPQTEVRVIPAAEYLRDFVQLGYKYYARGLPGVNHRTSASKAEVDARYPRRRLSDFLRGE